MNLVFRQVADPMHQFEVKKWIPFDPVFGYERSEGSTVAEARTASV